MIESLKIKNYKNIEEIALEDLKPIVLIGGSNNIGKTNILETIFLLHNRLNAEMLVKVFNSRGVFSGAFLPESVFEPVFYNFDMRKNVTITIKRNGLPEKFVIQANPKYMKQQKAAITNDKIIPIDKNEAEQNDLPIFELNLEYEKSGQSKERSHLLLFKSSLKMDIENATRRLCNVSYIPSRLRIDSNEDSAKYVHLELFEKQHTIINLLKIIEPRLINLIPITSCGTTIIHADIGIGKNIPINYMGEAISRILSIVMAIFYSANSFILIDEIENSIHYSLLPEIFKGIVDIAKSVDCQIIATTQSYELLEAAIRGLENSEYRDDFKYIRIERNEDNKLSSKGFDFEVLKSAIESKLEVR